MADLNQTKWIQTWNQKLHIYTGLYFLLFIWLFSFSGLLLNHSQWAFAQFWPQRKENVAQHTIRPPETKNDLEKATAIMAQLEILGELERITIRPKENQFQFRVFRPGHTVDIQVNFENNSAKVKEVRTNGWGIFRALHQFNGVRMEAPLERRNWIATQLWTTSMDALCLGLIFMVLSSLYMWYQLPQKRTLGLIILGAGTLCCAFFMVGL